MPLAVSIDNMIASVQREIGFRRKVYPRWVQQKKMRPETAPMEIERMEAVLEALEELRLARAFKVEFENRGVYDLSVGNGDPVAAAWLAWGSYKGPLTHGTQVTAAVAP